VEIPFGNRGHTYMEEEFVFFQFIGYETEIFIRLARAATENPLNPPPI
jgi:hypothetical protein